VINTSNAGVSVSVNLVIFGVVEIISYFTASFLLVRFPRKKLMIVISIAILVCNVLFFNFDDHNHRVYDYQKYFLTLIMGLNRFFVNLFWCVLNLYMVECFPISIKNIAIGIV
jgi:predicted MFS family arabinose efflux permease